MVAAGNGTEAFVPEWGGNASVAPEKKFKKDAKCGGDLSATRGLPVDAPARRIENGPCGT